MFITRRHLSRRTVLKGLGATVALPFLDAMIPAGVLHARARARKIRLVCIEMVHGAAGCSQVGIEKHLWAPAAAGRTFDLAPTSLRSLAPLQDYLTIVSNTDVPNADPFEAREIGGDHYRSSAVFLTQAHPKRTLGADVEAGTSFDQLYAQRFGQDTPIPSMQLCIEDVDQGGSCGYGYSCSYADSISWASPTAPLPMVRNPRVVFDELFGVFGSGATPAERRARRAEDRSILDWLVEATARLKREVGGADRARLDEYLQNVREIERRIQRAEALSERGEPGGMPDAPAGIPESFSEHARMMFDLQALAFASDITRVFSFKLGRDNSNRVYPESGFDGPFHPTSHHGGKEDRILDFAAINTYHVGVVGYLLEKLRNMPDEDGTMLDNALVLYGSPMGDSNLHNHKRVPFFVAGRGGGALKGGLHVRAEAGTSLASVMLTLLHGLGLDDIRSFGDADTPYALG